MTWADLGLLMFGCRDQTKNNIIIIIMVAVVIGNLLDLYIYYWLKVGRHRGSSRCALAACVSAAASDEQGAASLR